MKSRGAKPVAVVVAIIVVLLVGGFTIYRLTIYEDVPYPGPLPLSTAESNCELVDLSATSSTRAVDRQLTMVNRIACDPRSPSYSAWPDGLSIVDVFEFAKRYCRDRSVRPAVPQQWKMKWYPIEPAEAERYADLLAGDLAASGFAYCEQE